jgi:hypothetical protein
VGGILQFKATIKSDPAKRLSGSYQCTSTPEGIRIEKKKENPLTLRPGTPAHRNVGNIVDVRFGDRTVSMAIAKFPAYQTRLADAVAAFLRGERGDLQDGEFKIEWYLLVPAILPFGIMILTRGGAIWGALGGVVAFACLALVQVESIPKIGRLLLILGVNAMLYAAIVTLVAASSATAR